MSKLLSTFVKDFSKIVMPLTKLTRKSVKSVWDEKYEVVVQELKQRLTTTAILMVPNNNDPYVVYTNALGTSLWCVLMSNGRVVAYTSH